MAGIVVTTKYSKKEKGTGEEYKGKFTKWYV